MAEEVKLQLEVTAREAALIKYIRSTHGYTNITVTKIDGRIERIRNEELRTIKDLQKEYGLVVETEKPLDKPIENVIVE